MTDITLIDTTLQISATRTGETRDGPVRRIPLGSQMDKGASRADTRNPEALNWTASLARERIS